jgi:hypothetical protein
MTTKAITDVLAERQRQVEAEGWSAEHDDAHGAGVLSAAGMCYAGHATLTLTGEARDEVPAPWPWAAEWWKPKNPRRDLVRAAALLIAEIERIDRAAVAEGK